MRTAELLQMVAGVSPEEQVRRIPQWIEENYGYKLVCDSRWFGGVTDTKCLLGMRTFAQALIHRVIRIAPELITANVSEASHWRGIDMNTINLSMVFPYNAQTRQLRQFVEAQFLRPGYEQRYDLNKGIDALRKRLALLACGQFEFDEQINLLQAMAGLHRLVLICEENVELFKGIAEVKKLTNQFQFPYEENLKLKENLNLYSDVVSLRTFLTNQQRFTGHQSYFQERKLADAVRDELAQDRNIKSVICSALGSLTYKECLVALKRIKTLFNSPAHRLRLPKIDLFIITGASEMSAPLDYYTDGPSRKSILLLRQDFNLGRLLREFSYRGWLAD